MRFRITRHASGSPPEDALDLLSVRMGSSREDVRFARVGPNITAILDRDVSVAVTQDERIDIGRREVLDAISDICDRAPDLKLDWFAVSPAR